MLRPESIRSFFDNIAPAYDLLDHLPGLGRDQEITRKVGLVNVNGVASILSGIKKRP